MSKELEERVENLMHLEGKKKDAGRVQYQAKKAFDAEYDRVLGMVDSGHTMPPGAALFVEAVDTVNGRTDYKFVVDTMLERYGKQYGNTIREIIEESKAQPRRKLNYGPVATSS